MAEKTFLDSLLTDPEFRKLFRQEALLTRVLEVIAQAMDQRGVHQAELARRLGVSRQAVSALLSGRSNVTVRRIADVLGVLNCDMAVSLRLEDAAVPQAVHTWTGPWNPEPEAVAGREPEPGALPMPVAPEAEIAARAVAALVA